MKHNITNLNIWHLVLVRHDNFPSIQWPSGRIVQIHPDVDGTVRFINPKKFAKPLRVITSRHWTECQISWETRKFSINSYYIQLYQAFPKELPLLTSKRNAIHRAHRRELCKARQHKTALSFSLRRLRTTDTNSSTEHECKHSNGMECTTIAKAFW